MTQSSSSFMKKSTYNSIRLAGLMMTIIIFISNYFIPDKRLMLHPSSRFNTDIFGYINPTSGISGTWINKSENILQCDYKPENRYACGLSIQQNSPTGQGIDLTPYDGLLLKLNYEGPSKRLRVYIRNYNDKYSIPDNGESTKFMSMLLDIKEISAKPIFIHLSEFTVAEWWLKQTATRRPFSNYEIDNITAIGIDYVEPGLHKARISSIEVVGKYIKTDTLLRYCIFFWMVIFLMEGIIRFYFLYQKSKKEKVIINKLKNSQKILETERESLKTLSSTDPLTGVCNRSGMTQHLHNLFFNPDTPPNFGMLLIDIDYFKKINDTHGHDAGDRVLKSFSLEIARNMRDEDCFARWGGEEFIVITPKISQENIIFLSNKLRILIENHPFAPELTLNLTTSIGATIARKGDIFEDVFKRADTALYRAKNNGRNRVEYEH